MLRCTKWDSPWKIVRWGVRGCLQHTALRCCTFHSFAAMFSVFAHVSILYYIETCNTLFLSFKIKMWQVYMQCFLGILSLRPISCTISFTHYHVYWANFFFNFVVRNLKLDTYNYGWNQAWYTPSQYPVLAMELYVFIIGVRLRTIMHGGDSLKYLNWLLENIYTTRYLTQILVKIINYFNWI